MYKPQKAGPETNQGKWTKLKGKTHKSRVERRAAGLRGGLARTDVALAQRTSRLLPVTSVNWS